MKMMRLYPFVLACVMFAISFQLFGEYIMWFGFRDGFASELDRAEHRLAVWFVWFGVAMGTGFLVLGWRSFRADISKHLLYACILFLLGATITVGIDLCFRSYMMDSAGG